MKTITTCLLAAVAAIGLALATPASAGGWGPHAGHGSYDRPHVPHHAWQRHYPRHHYGWWRHHRPYHGHHYGWYHPPRHWPHHVW